MTSNCDLWSSKVCNEGKLWHVHLTKLILTIFLTLLDGRSIVDMNADGNCLFRSISDQLYEDYGQRHEEVRSEICAYMKEHKDDFAVFLVFEDEDDKSQDEDAKDFETYLENMQEDGEWGGNLELVAAARLYR